MNHFKFVIWWIRGFVFWCHEQVICSTFGCSKFIILDWDKRFITRQVAKLHVYTPFKTFYRSIIKIIKLILTLNAGCFCRSSIFITNIYYYSCSNQKKHALKLNRAKINLKPYSNNSFLGSFLEFIFSYPPIYFLQILFILFFCLNKSRTNCQISQQHQLYTI